MLRRLAPLVLSSLLLMLPTLPAAAADFSPGCTAGVGDAAALQSAVTTAGSNSSADTITLQTGCTYAISSTLTVDADSRNTLTINGNGATISGGNARQVLNIASGALVVLNGVTITGGNAGTGDGGGIFNDGTLTISNSTISGNGADFGGGIANTGTLTISNSTLSGNSANSDGGGIYNSSTLTISNSTLSGNSAGNSGGGIRNDSGTLTISNSIVANSTGGGDCRRGSGTINASHSLIEDGLTCVNGTSTNNKTGDPALDANLRLQQGSPAIDAGSNALIPSGVTTDLAGNPRIANSTVDMGAYESFAPPTATPTPTALADNLSVQTGGAITSGSGLNIVSRDGRIGNLYARVLALSGAYVTPNAPAEIGLQRLLDLGIYHAINLYGLLDDGTAANTLIQPLEICMRGTGEVLFVAAADPMRTIVRLASVDRGGYACVMLPSAGLLVMVNTPSGLPPQGSAPAARPAQADTPFTAFCQVTTTALVNLRAAPSTSAAILAEVPFGTTVTATARNAAGYYQVSYSGQMGYLSSAWVVEVGSCS